MLLWFVIFCCGLIAAWFVAATLYDRHQALGSD
jgi:hypothetical protein